TYQWYIGSSGNTTSPTGTGLSTLNVSPTSNTNYWVRVTGQCGSAADSNTATVTVTEPCATLSISAQPAGSSIVQGASADLSVTASGTGLTYQWYRGNSGVINNPLSGATSSTLQIAPTTTTNYWVRVRDSCGVSVNSNHATVTVCVPSSISSHPQSTSIVTGSSTNLHVSAGGTGLTYQWFIGSSGDTTSPTGTNSSSLNVSPTSTTSYWVRVTGQCGDPVNSNTATVTVTECAPPTITGHSGSVSIQAGNSTMLAVFTNGTAPFTYQWYIGNSGDTSNPTGTNSSSLNVSPATTTTYWVRVTGQCGNPEDSISMTVTVTAGCTAPSIVTQPQSISVGEGQPAILTVAASGTAPFTYQWYAGTTGNTGSPVTGGTAATLQVTPSVTTTYWVRVTGQCGSPADSAPATVTVSACTAPAIVSLTPAQSVVSGATIDLSVVASGTATLQYTWFEGELDDTSKPIGATATVNRKIEKSTKFWVRVINGCGEIRSSSVEITATPSRLRAVRR
ncbi:MAG TPA: hypothetical protein VF701_22275, partial [Thermoanaerobaculia bacterium]